jgi:gliding motility-associated-like protein
LSLTVLPIYEEDIFVAICTGSTYQYDGTTYTVAGIYDHVFQSTFGCDSIVHLNLSITDQITTELLVQNCTGGSFDFNGSLITEAGVYRDNLVSSNGCDSIVILTYQLQDVIETFQTFTICEGDSVIIHGQTYKSSVMLSDTNISIMGCDSVAYYEVVLVTSISLTGGDTVICAGETVQLEIGVEGNLSNPIHWTPSDGLSCDDCLDPLVSPSATATYQISTIGCLGAEITANYTVEIVPLPELSLIQNPGPNGGQEVVLSATTQDPTHSINWYDEAGQLICANCPNTIQVITQDQTFTAIAANSLGCEISEEIAVSLTTESLCDVGAISASNAMTPNGDGNNDVFQIVNSSDAEITLVQIFNRWGQIVFESRSPNDLWDGTYFDEPVNPGVYVYLIYGVCTEGDFQLVGNVTVIR